ncbi:MAG: VanZ family protein, partial [Calditrichales bacterium]
APFRFHSFHITSSIWMINLPDIIGNLALFFPIGYLYRMIRPVDKASNYFMIMLYGFLFSLSIESLQLFLPGRYSSISDVVCNTLGTGIGALAFSAINSVAVFRKGLIPYYGLPIIYIAYLLAPLLWLSGLRVTADEIFRPLIMVIPGSIGAYILITIFRLRVKFISTSRRYADVLPVVLWFILGIAPAFVRSPYYAFISICFLFLIVINISRFYRPSAQRDRRFEIPVLNTVLPLYFLYMICINIYPFSSTGWQFTLVPPDTANLMEPSFSDMFRLVEYIGSFSLLGYIISERFGRHMNGIKISTVLIFASAVIIELFKGFQAGNTGSLFFLMISFGAGIFGSYIYRMQVKIIIHEKPLHLEKTNPADILQMRVHG